MHTGVPMGKTAALMCIISGMILMPNVDGAPEGHLKVTAKSAHDLCDADGARNKSDPYMEIIAVDDKWNTVRKTTSIVKGNHARPSLE